MGTVIACAQDPCAKARSAPTRARNAKLVSWSQPSQRASIYYQRLSVILPNKGWKCLRALHRLGRMVRMAAHSHPHERSHAGHSHSHEHGHAGHSHPGLRPLILGWAMIATLGLVVAEIFGGILGRSVALLNDAVHNLSDVPALGISYLSMRCAQRPADSEKTYGYHRPGTLAPYPTAFWLVLLSLWLGCEA